MQRCVDGTLRLGFCFCLGPFKYKALDHYEKLDEAELPWAKGENWQVAREMDVKDLEPGLLEFLKELCEETQTPDGAN